jgi:hypothetical protein
VNPLNCLFERFKMPNHIEPAFGRYFLAIFRNQTDLVRQNPQCGLNNLRRISHLKVQLGHDAVS